MNRLVVLLVLTVVAISACSMLVKKPRIEKLNKVEMLTLRPDSLSLKLGLQVINPNFYGIRINQVEFEILDLKEIFVGTGELSEAVGIKGRSSENVDLILNLDTRKAVKTVDPESRSLGIIIRGNAQARALGFGKTQAIDQKYVVSIEDYVHKWIPDLTMDSKGFFRITDTEVDTDTTGKTRIKIHFLMFNPYGLDYELVAFPARIFLNDALAGKGELDAPVVVNDQRESHQGSMTFSIDNTAALISLGSSLLTKELKYEVKGTIHYRVFGVQLQNDYQFSDKLNLDLGALLRGLLRSQ